MENKGKSKAEENKGTGPTAQLAGDGSQPGTSERAVIDASEVMDKFGQLMEILDKQQQQINALQAQRDVGRPIGKFPVDDGSVIKRADHPEPGGGYLVKMPVEFTGTRQGVRFRGGYGVIPENHPQCDYLAHWLEADNPSYIVMPITKAQVDETLRKMEIIGDAQQPKSVGEKLMTMGTIGNGG